jgi:hypothetical protein
MVNPVGFIVFGHYYPCSAQMDDLERGRCISQDGLYWAFGGFFDLNTEANFCLKEVLELVEEMEEEEDLEREGIAMACVWVWKGSGDVV